MLTTARLDAQNAAHAPAWQKQATTYTSSPAEDKNRLRTGAQTSARYSGLFRLKLIILFTLEHYLSVLKQ
ncbi:hypothetical protein ACKUFS_13860 [Pseudomonas cannabina]|uniref:Uncharacterized protein n=2 Tax=Pseudomonas syringae group TaxID=136849 RepID=A0A8T8BZ57_PSEYM|nr:MULTISPECIES: hypothetical protein [Pseudomonas syringae group]MBM0142139.1 hypothetical protein [Pseudomonas cannabina pv. alisalensis]QHE96397.1 hypothetical protein PMA4326_007080 [Pseudomonas syringae pv. maculicola str. ES4326]QQN20544.1 hypothetical protein JGS08_18220 [Pseudomonas cannabina pv. alisalensis]UBY97055.1 hypothetical protein LCG56_24430 [Pseudomonas cannabina pv. alisalensis]